MGKDYRHILNLKNLVAQTTELTASIVDLGPTITLGLATDLSPEEQTLVLSVLKAFMPWKKGPFSIFGHHIDAEWRSDIKWERILPHLSSLQDKVIADIGCHNGYFMFRMASHNPRLVIGFDPVPKLHLIFSFLQQLAKQPNLYFEPIGVEHITLYPSVFDTVFCMGLLYHQCDPVGTLKKIHGSLKRNGELIVDCQGIPGDDPVALVPEKRYAGASGMWFLPTKRTLLHWIKRAGFRKAHCFFDGPLTGEEQRTTRWAPIQSLDDFLIPSKTSTLEGYPAPRRFYVKAIK